MTVDYHDFLPLPGGPPALGEADCQVCRLPKSNFRHGEDSTPPMHAADALSLAIFAINIYLDPTTATREDMDRYDDGAEAALEVLEALRILVHGLATVPLLNPNNI